MARVGSFAVSDLARVEQMADWLAALSTARQDDLAYSHSLPAKLALTPEGLRAGVNVFGPGNCASVTQSPISVSSVRGATSVILNQPYYIGNSLSILDRDLRLFTPAIENLGRLNRLAEYDPEYFLDDTG